MNRKKLTAVLLALAVITTINISCAPTPETAPKPVDAKTNAVPENPFTAAMITDIGGVNDLSFSQSAWEGLKQAEAELGIQVKYLESKQQADYTTNLNKLADEKPGIIWGIGFMMSDAVKAAAEQNPDLTYAIIDYAHAPEDSDNLIGVTFRAQEPSFLVGYIAARTTQTNKVGFIGGIQGDIIDQFEYGYRAGVAYGAIEIGKHVVVDVQYADSFTNDEKGKAIATQMYTNNCDIIFHAAGNVGKGLFEAATEMKKFAIGVDRDQSDAAPDYVLTSAMKLAGQAIYQVSKDVQEGKAEQLVGTTVVYGLKEGGVGLPENNVHVDPGVLEDTKTIQDDIINEKIVVPFDINSYNQYIFNLDRK